MGAFLEKPKTDKHNEHGSGNGLRFGVSSMQGWRIEMEDAHSAVVGLPHGLKDWSFFAVYDGHAGAKVSAHCAEHLLPAIVNAESFKSSMKGTQLCPTSDNVVHGVREGFLVLDETMRQLPEIQSGEDKSGSTAVCVLLSPMHIYFGNCGDSRAILCRDRKLFFSTQDHKPVNPVEKDRIQKAGGSVMIQRVNGSLAVSRALGDYEYKQVEGKGQCEQLVSPEPEVFMQERDCEKDEFLVLACDGVWDVMSNEDVCEFVSSRLAICDNFESICNQLVDTCLYKGSRDNMSVVLVAFQGAPKLSKEAIDKENELDALLEKRIQQIVESGDNPEEVGLCDVIHLLANEDIPSLPPGGGLCAKRSAIKSIFNRLYPNQNNDISDVETGQTLPAGKEGELCIKGPQIMKGYLNNPTTSAFTLDKERWIHTGDVGYVDEDECLYIVDSIKELIMYKAYQVAPAELAAKLLQHPSVADAAVIGVPDEEAGELPKAYVVRSDQCLLAEDLHSYLRVHVESMQKRVRGGIEFVSEIPMSASGKILRRQLRARNKKLSRL